MLNIQINKNNDNKDKLLENKAVLESRYTGEIKNTDCPI